MKIEGINNCDCILCMNNKSFDMPNEIIESVKKGELILFCGAGISTESKTVLPTSFYMDILEFLNEDYKLRLDTDVCFSKLMSEFCEAVPNGRKELIRKIKSRFNMVNSFPELYNSATRFHKEVASIPQIETIVTTNWDDYFEKECSAFPIIDNKDTAMWNTFKRRVFKIHGSINNMGSIVATKEDYESCYDRLKNDPIGDRLKTLLGSHCVVFVGFSFGDEDLNKIIDILSEKLGEFANQYYLITIDKSWENNKNSRIIPIITDGLFFMHSLKNILLQDHNLITDEIYSFSEYGSMMLAEAHTSWVGQDDFWKKLTKYPELLLSVAYQDGMIHAYQHCFANRQEGTYLKPDYILNHIHSYERLFTEHFEAKRFTYAFYDYGYSNGLLGLQAFVHTDSVELPPMFVYNEDFFDSERALIKYINENRNEETYNYCQQLVSAISSEAIPHFPPWYC